MKKAIIVSFFLLALVFSGCSSSGNSEIDQGGDKEGVKYRLDSGKGGICSPENQEACDRSCSTDDDCVITCPTGCIGKDQDYKDGSDNYKCEPMSCECENGKCKEIFN
jgi:hypothetical protein